MSDGSKQAAYLPVCAVVHGHTITVLKRNLEADDDDAGLGYFDFEAEDSIAVSTGTLLWDASVVLVDLLNNPGHQIAHGQSLAQLLQGRRVLELGSGIGLAGLCCATIGAHMLLSDLPSITTGILLQNIRRNAGVHSADPRAWPGALACGEGTVACMPVDFCLPLDRQVCGGCDAREAEVVLAADVVWLKELVGPLADTVSTILHSLPAPATAPSLATLPKLALLAFGERATGDSVRFVGLAEVEAAFRARDCDVTLAARQVAVRAPGEQMTVAVLAIQTTCASAEG